MTDTSGWPYGRVLMVVGSLDLLFGIALRLLGHPGNQGLPIGAACVVVLLAGIGQSAVHKRSLRAED